MTAFSVVIPAYNEEAGIAAVVEAVRAAAPGCEVIVVDDGSADGTASAAAAAGATVCRHPANAGYGRSLMDGIRLAANEVVVIADGDGSYPVERIPDLVAKLEEGFDMAVGARQGTQQYDSVLKAPARLLFKFLVEFTVGARIPDINSGLRCFRKSEVLPYFPDLCQGFSFTTTLTLIYKLTGKFVAYLPIEYRRRVGTSKIRIVRDTLRTLQYIVEVIVTYNPLKLFLLLCTPLGLLALAAAIAAVAARQPALWVASSICVAAGFLLFGLGLVAYQVRR
ncbi:Undecaprenyl-phosphate 4-deoxy-4-formamido-L-arabinose transferase [Aquisphaera giovannonii]|uniref:Undecaprenyl-phosphate 4-deoxy-4-formamido-L-arabinose transferase n=1 Tax=Aquisphaera giovannonii TaxID=406548 RepID=A0A5B9W531_9BACT|nr:glycosyltransferase family 2 protein [Aquisphaera giovannonii]QEH35299.1 Undecaprenyl-phosphate 4-deoxy-4-formamido-L-arabinose transferase [Aquisphaera giovannonii]